jgi:hypothetical protein
MIAKRNMGARTDVSTSTRHAQSCQGRLPALISRKRRRYLNAQEVN